MNLSNTELLKWLRQVLRQMADFHESAVGLRYSVERFVFDHGHEFPEIAPKRFVPRRHRKSGQCYLNCAQLALGDGQLTYVEGFAVLPDIALHFQHAWCVDENGQVVDPTWAEPGRAYFGVPFNTAYIRTRHEDQTGFGEWGSMLTVGDDGFALVERRETRPWRAEAFATQAAAEADQRRL